MPTISTNSFSGKSLKFPLIFLALMCIAGAVWVIILAENLPHSEIRKGITIDEAQSLVVFPICIPDYLSSKVDASYEIVYDADDAKVPEVTYIRLQYQSTDYQKKTLEIYQRYTPHERIYSTPDAAKINLLEWMFPFRFFTESSILAAMEQTQIKASYSETDETIWWLYEITDPSKYRSTMTTWASDHVEYRVLSHLPAEEIKKITFSMFKCSSR